MLAPNIYKDVDGRFAAGISPSTRAAVSRATPCSRCGTRFARFTRSSRSSTARARRFHPTLLRQYQEGGRLPVWELAANETDTMIGYHAVPVITDASSKASAGSTQTLAPSKR